MKGQRALRIAQLLTAAAGAVLCTVLCPAAGGVLLLTGLVVVLLQLIAERQRKQALLHLCDEIDRILHGAETIDLRDYEEGELGILSAEVRKMTIRLREQNAALKREKLAMKEALEDMSHQLRTPLTTIVLITEHLRRPELSRQERMQQVREMQRHLSQMQWILETLLKLSRMEAGAVTFQRVTFPVSDLIREAEESLSVAYELKGVTLVTQIEGEPVFTADFRYCAEALGNLLKNCLEHTPEGGTVTVRAFRNALYTGLTVTDTGEGFGEQELPHVFERFYHRSGKNGYGLGLAFARSVVASQNGSLEAANAQPHGAEFSWRMYDRA